MEKFFTWMDATYAQKSDVPDRLILEMKVMTKFGAKPEELSTLFNLPIEWVCEFVEAPIPDGLKN
jgi:hypothetical protein